METVKHLIPVLLMLSLGLLIVSAAMSSSKGQFVYVLRRPLLLLRAIAAVDLVPVIGALAVVTAIPGIPRAARVAILLMAISPVPPLVPGKSLKFGGQADYVLGLQAAMGLFAIVSVPLLGALVATIYDADAQFPPSVVAMNVATGLILPLIIGLALSRWIAPDFSKRAAPWVARFGNLLLVIAFVPIIIGAWPAMIALLGDGSVIAMALVVCIAILGGWLLGEPDPSERTALVFASAMRHPGIALALVSANHANPAISAGVLLFLLTGIVVLIPYQILLRRTEAKTVPDAATTS